MADLLDRIHRELLDRLEESRTAMREYEQLEAALRALDDDRPPEAASPGRRGHRGVERSGAPEPTAPQGAATPKRAARGANRDAVLRALDERPGASVSELATTSGVPKTVLYGVLRTLVHRGEAQTRELPSGRTGYVRSASTAPADASPSETEPAAASTPEASPATAPRPATRRSVRRS
ncbi:MAG: hypothetical protein QOD81_723 [Solirubrobacteraceae bacterium]|jgi:hypothetical protein|nr:hypothetical protein [Solirubrobacteraceae bacterium]